jgi:uncharacterized membrane protein
MEHTNQQSSLDPKGIAMPEPNQSGLSDNAAGAIAYITIVPAIVFLVLEPYNKSAFIRFHAWQSIFFSIVAFVVYVALKMFFMVGLFFASFLIGMLSLLIWLAFFLVWILCVIQAVNGKCFKLPILGALAEKQAGQ